ncbi:hypothetical protein C8Q74DRAFT_1220433 [Fomes fomentarius]|nr:hypothetical protein C8Q74DRAFT_1220433 [Fomes fomentarius]
MSAKQDKATTERHARILRELLKNPENKTCADCKRNDPRWASWNLGVFLCIRCSGIHRSMGTHISKVKSVDLDVWTPEQMASVQKWGNRRANLYWEAHLRAGHIPPDHKMDSYIRSKYETRRWAREGPPPQDPSVLDGEGPPPATAPQAIPPAQPIASPTHASRASLSSLNAARSTQPHQHQLLSTAVAASRQAAGSPVSALPAPQRQQPQPQVAPQAAQQQQKPQSAALDLFSLDFHAPASPSPQPQQEQPKKDVKAEIMSLFSAATPAATPVPQQNAFGGGECSVRPLLSSRMRSAGSGAGLILGQQTQQQPQTSMMGNAGVGLWGASSGWNSAPATAAQPQANIWGTPAPTSQQSLFSTSDVWGAPAHGTTGTTAAASTTAQKNNDAFGDLWGGFK